MTDAGPAPSASPTPSATPSPSGTSDPTPTTSSTATPAAVPTRTTTGPTRTKDGLGHTRTSGIWAAVVALVILLVLLAIFVLQNVQQVEVSYFGWEGRAPLASALLIATALGALIAVIAGTLRILQLRRRVRRAQRH